MALDKQMEMFDEGGLMDEGGTVDPVSGNDVPPGSTQEEVRDDIPAQLSEGEFVFPADVVRFIGLNNLMQMRQQAKMGLKTMEDMGQMGNSEEATMPDDLPFDINDLDMEDELEYNVGGFVPATQQQQQMGISGMQQAAAPTTGVAAAPQQAASQQYVQPAQAAVPTTPVYTAAEIPTFKGFVGENVPGVDFEYVDYTNDAGNIIKLRKSKTTGELLDPVPEGYSYVDPTATQTQEVTTTPTTPQTTSVRQESDGDDERRKQAEEDKYGPGGGRIGIPGTNTVYGVSFDGMKTGFLGLPSLPGTLGAAASLATGKPLDKDVTVNFKLDNDEFTMTADEYNNVKKAFNNNTLSRKEKQDIFAEARVAAKTRKARQAIEEAKEAEDRVKTSDVFKGTQFEGSGGDESVDTSAKGAALEASLRGSPTPSGTGEGRQDYSGGYNQSSSSTNSSSTSDNSYDNYAESFSDVDDYSYFQQGGLASKKKPKAKKMKRGGLASKK